VATNVKRTFGPIFSSYKQLQIKLEKETNKRKQANDRISQLEREKDQETTKRQKFELETNAKISQLQEENNKLIARQRNQIDTMKILLNSAEKSVE